jgi:hypothetical protein
VIRIDQLWLCTAPMDMRAGAERLLSCVVQTTGAAHAHHGYLFANVRAKQPTFSIPIAACRDRVSAAPVTRQEGPVVSAYG